MCVIWSDLQSDSAMPTGVKLATDRKVDGHEAKSCLQSWALKSIVTVAGAENGIHFHEPFL